MANNITSSAITNNFIKVNIPKSKPPFILLFEINIGRLRQRKL